MLSVDFVASAADGFVSMSSGGGPFVAVNTTSFNYDTIGYMHQATLDFSDVPVGAQALYRVATSAGASTTFSITPQVAVPRYAVYGDFGREQQKRPALRPRASPATVTLTTQSL